MTATLDPIPFADLAARTEESGPREAAFARFAAVGIPTSKDEEWRFTPVRHLGSTRYAAPGASPQLTESDIAPFLIGTPDYRVVVVDGRVDTKLSRLGSGGGLRVAALSGAGASGSSITCAGDSTTITTTPFAALNAALWTDGAALHIADGCVIDTPIEILHVTTAAAGNAVVTPRTVLCVGTKARATVVESFVSLTGDPYFTNTACEIVMEEGSWLEHARIQRESMAATHIGLTTVHQATESHYRSFTLALGAKVSRHNLHAHLDAPNVESLLYGLYIGRDDQLLDNHTAIFHDHPNCNSWEVYKGVLAERSHGVFNGKVIVQPAAQKTDAKQTNRNLLLSDTAKVDTKPQLEIFADDVKCTHGATVGKLNEQQRFYLRTRGIAGRAAELMLITAFVAEVLAEITHPGIREVCDALVRAEIDALVG
ncbi:MAG: Fe-S cluster assembly protein SufD [Gemmatimonadota bacterium]